MCEIRGILSGRPPAFHSLDELIHWLEQRCKALWQKIPNPEDKSYPIEQIARDITVSFGVHRVLQKFVVIFLKSDHLINFVV